MKRIYILMLALLPLSVPVHAEDVLKRGTCAEAPGSSFAFGLFREVAARDDGNIVFISPLSASMALSMTASGAEGSTLVEMLDALGYEEGSVKAMNESAGRIMDTFRTGYEGIELNMANSVWISDRFKVRNRFIKTARNDYGAEAANLDFSDPASAGTINRWCSENTGGRITGIVDRIDPGTVMYLINALYFKGQWQTPFDPGMSRQGIFHGDAADSEVRFMNMTGRFMHYSGPEGSLLELPYGDGTFVMDIILPGEGVSADRFVTGLDAEAMTALTGLMQAGTVRLSMPAFTAEYSTSLKALLMELGMRSVFAENADFSGISKDEAVRISDVRQKTFIEVNETGSEAAAITSVSVMTTSLHPETVNFTVDRPFVFLIRERASGTVLFAGLVRNL